MTSNRFDYPTVVNVGIRVGTPFCAVERSNG